MMAGMDLDWQRLGKALQAARKAKDIRLTQPEMAKELGVGRSVIQLIEAGTEYKKPTPTIRAYARRVGWTDDSADRVLAGGEPTLVGDAAPAEPAELSGLPGRIKHELGREGELVDTVVIKLPGGGTAVVVVKDQPDATPEQRQKNLEAWLKTQPALESLDYSDTGSSSDR
jgi:DNA-binding XRE family transcriptional regulator